MATIRGPKLGIPKSGDPLEAEGILWRLRLIERHFSYEGGTPKIDGPLKEIPITAFDTVSLDVSKFLDEANDIEDKELLALYGIELGRLSLGRKSISLLRRDTIDGGNLVYECACSVVRAKLAILELNAMVTQNQRDFFKLVEASSSYLEYEADKVRQFVDEARLQKSLATPKNIKSPFSLMVNALKGLDKRNFQKWKKAHFDEVQRLENLKTDIRILRRTQENAFGYKLRLNKIRKSFPNALEYLGPGVLIDVRIDTDSIAKRIMDSSNIDRTSDELRKLWDYTIPRVNELRKHFRSYCAFDEQDPFFNLLLRLTQNGLANPIPFIKPNHIPGLLEVRA